MLHKFTPFFFLFFATCLLSNSVIAQADYRIFLKDTSFVFPENIKSVVENADIQATEVIDGLYYRFVQFWTIPSQDVHQQLQKANVQLLEYVSGFTYLAAIPVDLDKQKLFDWKVRGVLPIAPSLKIGSSLRERPFLNWAVQGNQLEVLIQYFKPISTQQIQAFCKTAGITIVQQNGITNYLLARIPMDNIETVAALPWVNYLDIAPPPGRPDDLWGRNLHRASLLDNQYGAGRHLTGEGIGVLVRDDGIIGPHIDLHGRLIQAKLPDGTAQHADGVAGILSGAGNLDPNMRGMAAGALTYNIPYRPDFLDSTLALHINKNVLITNSSYSDTCNALTLTTQIVDQQLFAYPSLLHVFSAGNSNGSNCGYGAGSEWGNITGGHKQGKNVITTANLDRTGMLAGSSSRGPAYDGRIKPDIAAHGNGHFSLSNDNSYQEFGGTSAASPGIAGIAAQLYQAYKEHNGGNLPESALIKACMLNTATDLGTPGPDFQFGWGQVHALRAVKVLEENRYIRAEVAHQVSNHHTIIIPVGVQEVRVMTYWPDKEASNFAPKALVSNLNTYLQAADGSQFLPLVLNTTPVASFLSQPAQPGIDDLNNMEQVRLLRPQPGAYELVVEGTLVPFGAQPYFVVYEFLMNEVKVVYPIGGEGLQPNARTTIHWDAYGNEGNFTLESSFDDGASWSHLAFANGATRFYNWLVPDTVVTKARIRVSRGEQSDVSANYFSILARPSNVRHAQVCPEYVQIQWDSVPGATHYVVFKLGERYMDSIGVTTTFSLDVPVISPLAEGNWFAVEARGSDGMRSLRTVAIPYKGDLIDCKQDTDFSVTNSTTIGGTRFTFCEPEHPVQIWIKNKGILPQDSFTVGYQLNAQPPVLEFITDTLQPGDSTLYTFATNVNIDSTGDYTLKIWTAAAGEQAAFNDTLSIEHKFVLFSEEEVLGLDTLITFQDSTPIPTNWLILNPDNQWGWEIASVIGSKGRRTRALAVYNYFYLEKGQRDIAQTGQYALPDDTSSLVLAFDLAYAYINGFVDTLQIDISTDCGATFEPIYKNFGEGLQTATLFSAFSPDDAGDWQRIFVDISAYKGKQVVFRFVNTTEFGNNIFIDNIGVERLSPPVVSFTTSSDVLCRQQDITFTSTSTGSISKLVWRFGQLSRPAAATGPGPHTVSYLSQGEKEVRILATGPFGTDTLYATLTVHREPKSDFEFTTNDLEVTFQNTSTDATTYFWDFGDGMISTEENPIHIYAEGGTYQIRLSAISVCGIAEQEQTIVLETVGVEDTKLPFTIELAPNPTTQNVWLKLSDVPFSKISVRLLSLQGNVIQTYQLQPVSGTLTQVIEMQQLPKGMYLLEVGDERDRQAFKLIVQ